MTATGDQTPRPITEQKGAQYLCRERNEFKLVFFLIPCLLVAVFNTELWPHSDSQSKYANKSVQICLQSALAN